MAGRRFSDCENRSDLSRCRLGSQRVPAEVLKTKWLLASRQNGDHSVVIIPW